MLLTLWPLLFPRNNAHSGGTYVDPDVTHRAIRGKEQVQRTAAMLAAEAHLLRLREAGDGTDDAGGSGSKVGLGSLPIGNIGSGGVTVRVLGHERTLAGRIPAALGASLAASDAISYRIDYAVMRARQQTDDDDDMAMIAIMMAGAV